MVRNDAIAAAAGVRFRVERDAQKLEAVATSGAQRGGVLANAAGEGHGVDAAHGGGVSANGLLNLVNKNLQRLDGARVARCGGLFQVAHIAALDPRSEEHTSELQS